MAGYSIPLVTLSLPFKPLTFSNDLMMNRQIALIFSVIAILITGCGKDQFSGDDGSFKDTRDKQVYKWLRIGEQIWMAENLAYLPGVNPSGDGSLTVPKYYVYDHETSSISEAKSSQNFDTYGVLYNWNAAMISCPAGWHLPTDAEWTELTDFLGEWAGNHMKEAGIAHWEAPNLGSTNASGFTALPGGFRNYDTGFSHLTVTASYWTATDEAVSHAWKRYLYDNDFIVYRRFEEKSYGHSVRCVKDPVE